MMSFTQIMDIWRPGRSMEDHLKYPSIWTELSSLENTVVVKILHWTSNFLCSTVTMEFPGPFNDFLLRVWGCS